MAQGDCTCDNEDGAAEDASSSNTGDCATDDERSGVRCNTTDQRANFKDEQSDDVDPFDRVEGVEFSIKKLCRAGGEQVR